MFRQRGFLPPLMLSIIAAWILPNWWDASVPHAQEPLEKLVVYNHITGSAAALDKLVHETFGPEFKVIDFSNRDGTYIPPTLKIGSPPAAPLDANGAPIEGTVVVLYIISADGWVLRPVVIQSTDPRLDYGVLDTLASWRFEPARLEGRVVSTTAGQEFDLIAPRAR